jgi:hypothetical protein
MHSMLIELEAFSVDNGNDVTKDGSHIAYASGPHDHVVYLCILVALCKYVIFVQFFFGSCCNFFSNCCVFFFKLLRFFFHVYSYAYKMLRCVQT